jgi:hypothetical protein
MLSWDDWTDEAFGEQLGYLNRVQKEPNKHLEVNEKFWLCTKQQEGISKKTD